jgi:hypothetical protein
VLFVSAAAAQVRPVMGAIREIFCHQIDAAKDSASAMESESG